MRRAAGYGLYYVPEKGMPGHAYRLLLACHENNAAVQAAPHSFGSCLPHPRFLVRVVARCFFTDECLLYPTEQHTYSQGADEIDEHAKL